MAEFQLTIADRALLADVVRPLSSQELAAGSVNKWILFKLEGDTLIHAMTGTGPTGDADALFERLKDVSGTFVALARFQVQRDYSQLAKMFVVYFNPTMQSETSTSVDSNGNPVAGTKNSNDSNTEFKQKLTRTFRTTFAMYIAANPQDLRVEIFSDQVLGYATGAGTLVRGNRHPSVSGGARRSYVSTIRLAEPFSGHILRKVASDHVVIAIDSSAKMRESVLGHTGHDSTSKLALAFADALSCISSISTKHPNALFDVMWFHGSDFGSWQLDSNGWGKSRQEVSELMAWMTALQDKELVRKNEPRSYSNQGLLRVLKAAMAKQRVEAVHVILDGSHDFDETLPTQLYSMISTGDGGGTRRRVHGPQLHFSVIHSKDPAQDENSLARAAVKVGYLRNMSSLTGGSCSDIFG